MTPVLYYHRVGPFRPGSPKRMTVLPDRFEAQMEYLARRWKPVSLDDIVSGQAPPRSVAVTFDDGYADLLEHALPVLKRLKIPATFFIVAGSPGGKDTWYRGEEELLDWKDILGLHRDGFSIGSHSMTHPRLDALTDTEQEREITESRQVLEKHLGIPIRHFAYPAGRADARAAARVRKAGYSAGWGTQSGWDPEFVRQRLAISAETGPLRFRLRMLKARLGYYGGRAHPPS